MGDRVLMQCFSSSTGEFGPVVYCHNSGHGAKKIVQNLRRRMATRQGDLSYSSARLVQEALATYPDGNLSFGIWNAKKLLTAEDSHGDAGCVIIYVDKNHTPTYMGGYLGEDE